MPATEPAPSGTENEASPAVEAPDKHLAPWVLLLPLALLGIHKRSWWIALGVLAIAAIPFGTLWVDYLTVLRNSAVPATYSVLDLPLALAPVIAWIGRSDRRLGIQMPWTDVLRRVRIVSRARVELGPGNGGTRRTLSALSRSLGGRRQAIDPAAAPPQLDRRDDDGHSRNAGELRA